MAIAVARRAYAEWGCPTCGFRSGAVRISNGDTAVVHCGECDTACAMLAEGVERSSIGFGDEYPELQKHPREGTPAHGTPDRVPPGGGEYFHARGIGKDWTPGCFVCDGSKVCGSGEGLHTNISGFVVGKDAGERVVKMFKSGAWCDFRPGTPDRVQVKIGACKEHLKNLERLAELCLGPEGRVIKEEFVREAAELK